MKQFLLSVLVMIALLSACTSNNTKNSPATAAGPTTDTIPVFILRASPVEKPLELPAELLPYEQVELSAKVAGYIQQLKVDIGDRVRKGQTLAVLEAPEIRTKHAEYQAALAAAQARYRSSVDVYERLDKASRAKTAGIVAPVDLERSRNQKLADSAAYESARRLAQSYGELAGYLVIKAPFSGTVTARHADRGALVGESSPILTVQHTDVLRLRVAVPELYVSTATASRKASFRVESSPDKSYAASLVRKSGAIDPRTRTEIWEYAFDNEGNALKAGSFAYVKLNLQREAPSFVVAPSVVTTSQERRFVIRVKDNQAIWEDVRQGMSTEKGIEIFGNLQEGDTLVVRATDERKPGTTGFWKVAL